MLPLLATVALASYTKPVTALSLYAGSLYVGRADGGVDRVGPSLDVQSVLANPGGAPVSFVAASANGVAWLSGPGGAIRDRAAPGTPAPQKLTVFANGRSFTAMILPSAPIRRVAWLSGRVAISYDIGVTFFDSRAKAIDPASFMPSEVAALAKGSALWVREQEDGTELAVFARPYAVRQNVANQKAPLVSLFTAYQVGAWQWAKLGGFASNALDAFPDGELKITDEGRITGDTKFLVLSERVGLANDGIVAREPESIASVPIYDPNWAISRIPAAAVPGDALWFGASSTAAWWWNGTALVQQTRPDGASSAYLPWAASDLRPAAFVTDSNGLWVGSNRGLAHLDPTSPGRAGGYAGFVKAPFGVEATSSSDPTAAKLSKAVFAWRFATPEQAGADGGLMIASIYSTVGLQLPTTASELMNSGEPVVDELKFGDAILTPKSAALYLGNGITAEMRDGHVQNGTVWNLREAKVRRFVQH